MILFLLLVGLTACAPAAPTLVLPTQMVLPSLTPTASLTDAPTASPTPTSTDTATPTPTLTASDTMTPTDLPSATPTPTDTPTPTNTRTPTPTPTATDTPTSTLTPTPTLTPTASNTPRPTGVATAIVSGGARLAHYAPAVGVVARPGVPERYFFDVEAGERYTVVVSAAPGSALVPRIEVYNPDGEWILLGTVEYAAAEFPDATGMAILGSVRLPMSGTYALFVSGERQTTGGFVIGVGRTMPSGGIAHVTAERGILPAEEVGRIEPAGVRDSWTLALQAGTTVEITASSERLALGLDLVAPDGSVVASAFAFGAPDVVLRAPIATSGDYTLYVADTGALRIGDYLIGWRAS